MQNEFGRFLGSRQPALSLFLLSMAACIAPAAAQQAEPPERPTVAAENEAKSSPAPGAYRTVIFEWDTLLTIDRVDDKGQLHGRLQSCPNAVRRKYGLACSTADFETQAGADGLPQRVNPKPVTDSTSAGNDYTRIRACDSDVCARVSRMVGREDGKGDELAEVDIRFAKQAPGTGSPDSPNPEPAPLPSAARPRMLPRETVPGLPARPQ